MNLTFSELLKEIEHHPVLVTVLIFVFGSIFTVTRFFLKRRLSSKPNKDSAVSQAYGNFLAGGDIVVGNKTTVSHPLMTPTQRPVARPQLEYQKNALDQIINHLKRQGINNLTRQQFAQVISTDSRDGEDPIFEPVTVDSLSDAINEFIDSGLIVIANNQVQITDKVK